MKLSIGIKGSAKAGQSEYVLSDNEPTLSTLACAFNVSEDCV